MVTIGNPGNAPDTRYVATGIGSVDHVYRIGKYEVTAGQYTEFLNAVAQADPNFLYNSNMAILANKGANIVRTGASPNFSYSVDADWADRPVNIVSFWDAARFANWLHNGQPAGPQGPGSTEDGAYHNVGNDALFGRNPGARYFIPNANEWYKAAFHDKTAGLAASYFDFPTSNNTAPGNDATEVTSPGNNANHSDVSPQGAPFYRTVVGEYELSASPYGTFDQAGNVYEWSETEVPFPFGSTRELRGGSFYDGFSVLTPSATLRASNQSFNAPTSHFNNVGFRVASSVPEPATVLLAAAATFMILTPTRERRIL
jgi:formylglycine-generating enzyme required for sulfatase activity